MENLENQIINRLNNILDRYNLEIISKNNHNYKISFSIADSFKKYCLKYNLVEIENNTIIECYYTWDTIKSILIESTEFSLFNLLKRSQNTLKNCIECGIEPPGVLLIINKLYNELICLNNCTSYEEIMIKMDLMGI